jgi:hypothetical protein
MGQSKTPTQIASLARVHTQTVINVLIGIVTREDAPMPSRIAAGLALLDRGWGKPLQKVELEGDRPAQITEIINYIVDPKDPDSPIRILETSSRSLPEVEASEATLVPEADEPGEPESDVS